MPSILWWGRSDRNYSRNRIILDLMKQSGVRIVYFHPVSSWLGTIQAAWHRFENPDLIWVPCFRQRDIHSAAFWARRWGCGLVVDPLISAYEKEVFEKGKWPEQSSAAQRMKNWEGRLLRSADVVVADTPLHAEFFIEQFQVAPPKTRVMYVGAEKQLFKYLPLALPEGPLEVLFCGSFLQLQGVDVIIEAARLLQNENIRWVLLGDGDLRPAMERKAQGLDNLFFESWIAYQNLPQRIAQAHILLGIFGKTPKAHMVIPNKVFQAMAVGRPLITLRSGAYPAALGASETIGWVPAGDARALAATVRRWGQNPQALVRRAEETRALFDHFFNEAQLQADLSQILDTALHFQA